MDINKDDELVLLGTSGWNKLDIPAKNESKFAIVGNESQVLTIALSPSESIHTEPGTMMFLTSGIRPAIHCYNCCARVCSGECCYDVSFTNTGKHGNNTSNDAHVSLTPNFPTAKVVPIHLNSEHVNGTLLCQRGSYMARYGDVRVGVNFDWNFMRCCCAGTGFVQQELSGSGTVFLASTGTMVQKVLGPDEVILVDTHCILAWSGSVKIHIRRAGGFLGMAGGGEGIVNTTMTGPGLVVIRSMGEETFRNALNRKPMWRR